MKYLAGNTVGIEWGKGGITIHTRQKVNRGMWLILASKLRQTPGVYDVIAVNYFISIYFGKMFNTQEILKAVIRETVKYAPMGKL